LNIEVLDKRIFLYTPRGDVIELPTGSSVLDFAFTIHTDIGLRFKNAIVNGEIKPISYLPVMGDVVHINTFKNRSSANKHWLDFLHTPGARNSLTRFLKNQQKDDIIKQMLKDLNNYLQSLHLSSVGSQEDKVSKLYTKDEIEKKLFTIFDKKDTFSALVKEVYPAEWKLSHKQPAARRSVSKPIEFDRVVVDGDSLLNYYFCPECKPSLGDRIIAKTGRDGIKIHTLSCRSMKTVGFDKLLEAHRIDQPENLYRLSMELKISTQYGTIMHVIKIFSELNIEILQVSMKNLEDGMSIVILESAFTNPARITFLLNSLKKIDDSLQVLKKKIL
jgi:GTP pyrophosphokinase